MQVCAYIFKGLIISPFGSYESSASECYCNILKQTVLSNNYFIFMEIVQRCFPSNR